MPSSSDEESMPLLVDEVITEGSINAPASPTSSSDAEAGGVTVSQPLVSPAGGEPVVAVHKLSVAMMLILTFINNASFAIVIPSLWPYLDSLSAPQWVLGWVVAAYSAGQFAFSPIFGFWSNRRPVREVLLVSGIISVLGNGMYCVGISEWIILGARILVGIGSANVGVCRAYMAHATPPQQRTAYMAYMSAAQNIGFILGPGYGQSARMRACALTRACAAIGAGLANVNFSMGVVVVNEYTAPAYLSAILSLLSILPLLCVREVSFHSATHGEDGQAIEKPHKAALIVTIILFVITISEFAVLETIMVPVTHDIYNWSVITNGLLFTACGAESIVIFVLVRVASRWLSDRVLMIIGFVVMTPGFGALIMIHNFSWNLYYVPLWQFCVAVAVVCIGYPICAVVTYSVFSKVIGPHAQGTYMGWLTGFGSVARMVGPIWSTFVLDNTGPALVWLICAALGLVGLVISIASFRILIPHISLRRRENKL